jgi:hypothetical protein
MTHITQQQFDSLVAKIYQTLINFEECGLGEIADCQDEAERIVHEWCEESNVILDF